MTKPNYYFIGDLHGQFDKLTELLEYLDFVPEERDSAASCVRVNVPTRPRKNFASSRTRSSPCACTTR